VKPLAKWQPDRERLCPDVATFALSAGAAVWGIRVHIWEI
jgi:hypothetical protein